MAGLSHNPYGGGGSGMNQSSSSYSMLFSPAASSLASTPGGGDPMNRNSMVPPPTTPLNFNQQQNQQQELELNWDPTRVKSELLKASAILSHRCLKLAGKWAAEQVMGIPVGSCHPVVTLNSNASSSDSNQNNDDVDLSFTTNDGSLDDFAASEEDPSLSMTRELSEMTANDWYAKSLFELGEFLHAAYILSAENDTTKDETLPKQKQPKKDISRIGPPKANLSSYGFYIRAYSLYMAGERRKEEDFSELEVSGAASNRANNSNPNEGGGGAAGKSSAANLSATKTQARNPYLSQLIQEVSVVYQNSNAKDGTAVDNDNNPEPKLDAFGLYLYGMLLKEAQKDSMPCPHPPHAILVESILEFPLNWSAWLDLCEVLTNGATNPQQQQRAETPFEEPSILENGNLEQQVEQALQPTLATHYMYHFFCAHLMAHYHNAHEDALVLLERLHEPLPDQPLFQSPHVKTQLAVVHYHLRELENALSWFRETSLEDPYSLDHKDVFSNILYVKEDRVALSHLAHEAVVIDKYRPETCCIVGNYYSLKQQRHKAVLYFQRALKLDRSYTSAWTLMGHEYVELKQTEQAMESYRRAVTVSPKDYRAWYGLGQTYEFLNMYLYALFYYRKAATLRPYDPRMWCALGQCFSALHKIPDAIRAYERAVSQDDTEGIATQKLAACYRVTGNKEAAAKCYLRHLELRYWITCVSPEHQSQQESQQHPTLDTIVQGIALEAVEAEALLFLAQYFKSVGEYDTAALLCSRLVEYPGPEKEQAKGLLRDLRSRGRRYPVRATQLPPATPDSLGGDSSVEAPGSASMSDFSRGFSPAP